MNTRTIPPAAGVVTWVVTAVVSAAGVVMSASQLVDLAKLAGWGSYTAWLLPVLLDGSGVAGGLACRYGRSSGARGWGLAVLIESAALSVFGNVAAHLIPAHPPAWVMVVVAVAVPLQIVLTVHMAMLLAEGDATTATGGETATEPSPAEVAALAVETTEAAEPSAEAETAPRPVRGPTETPAVSVSLGTDTTGRNTETATETPAAGAPAPAPVAVETATAPRPVEGPTETPRRVVPFRRAEESTAEPTLIERSPYTGDESEGPQAAMWRVFCAHQQAGTDHELNATRLAQEAGQGSRQIAGRYLAKWRNNEVVTA